MIAPAVPVTSCDEIAIAPSEIAVQPAPRPPSARLKSSDADVEPVLAAQVTATLVTLAEPIVPDPLATVQVCPDGLVFTVTAYPAPVVTCVANVNGPFAVTVRSSPPLSCSTTVPDRPDTDPPTVNDAAAVVQDTATLVTFAEPIVPDPLATVHVCPDGLVFTVTAYAAPVATLVANVNGPLAVTDRSSPPLSCSTTVPDRPETDPPTVNDRRPAPGAPAGPAIQLAVAVGHDPRRAAGERAIGDRQPLHPVRQERDRVADRA